MTTCKGEIYILKMEYWVNENKTGLDSKYYFWKEIVISTYFHTTTLTHISLSYFLLDIGKQNSPRCEAAKRGFPSGAILFAHVVFIEK